MKKYTGTLTPRPSMICRKLHYQGKIDPDSTEIAILHTTPNIQFGYDVDNGEIKVTLNQEHLKESINELKQWMKDNKIPLTFEDDCMFYLDTSELCLDDIQVLLDEGFEKQEIQNGNSINTIWNMGHKPEKRKFPPIVAVDQPKKKLLDAIFTPMTDEEKKNCDGYKSSVCCGALITEESPFCEACKEHAANECSECKENDCPNRLVIQ